MGNTAIRKCYSPRGGVSHWLLYPPLKCYCAVVTTVCVRLRGRLVQASTNPCHHPVPSYQVGKWVSTRGNGSSPSSTDGFIQRISRHWIERFPHRHILSGWDKGFDLLVAEVHVLRCVVPHLPTGAVTLLYVRVVQKYCTLRQPPISPLHQASEVLKLYIMPTGCAPKHSLHQAG